MAKQKDYTYQTEMYRQQQPYGTAGYMPSQMAGYGMQQPGTQPQSMQGYMPYTTQAYTGVSPYGVPMGTPGTPSGAPITGQIPGMLPLEESYIENILRLNKGKRVTVYMTFENNPEWNAKIFKGIIEAAGRDHLVLSDPETGMRYLLPMIYFNYATFEEEIEYEYPFAGGGTMAQYTPR